MVKPRAILAYWMEKHVFLRLYRFWHMGRSGKWLSIALGSGFKIWRYVFLDRQAWAVVVQIRRALFGV